MFKQFRNYFAHLFILIYLFIIVSIPSFQISLYLPVVFSPFFNTVDVIQLSWAHVFNVTAALIFCALLTIISLRKSTYLALYLMISIYILGLFIYYLFPYSINYVMISNALQGVSFASYPIALIIVIRIYREYSNKFSAFIAACGVPLSWYVIYTVSYLYPHYLYNYKFLSKIFLFTLFILLVYTFFIKSILHRYGLCSSLIKNTNVPLHDSKSMVIILSIIGIFGYFASYIFYNNLSILGLISLILFILSMFLIMYFYIYICYRFSFQSIKQYVVKLKNIFIGFLNVLLIGILIESFTYFIFILLSHTLKNNILPKAHQSYYFIYYILALLIITAILLIIIDKINNVIIVCSFILLFCGLLSSIFLPLIIHGLHKGHYMFIVGMGCLILLYALFNIIYYKIISSVLNMNLEYISIPYLILRYIGNVIGYNMFIASFIVKSFHITRMGSGIALTNIRYAPVQLHSYNSTLSILYSGVLGICFIFTYIYFLKQKINSSL